MNETSLHRWISVRLVLGALVLASLFGVVVHRAYRLQAVEGPRLREMAEQQYLREVELPPRRGTIYDRHGIPLAVSVDVDSVYANPRQIGSRAAEVARQLAEVLGTDPWAIQRQLSTRRYFTWVGRRVSSQRAQRIKKLGIRGLDLTKESQRFYPNHGLGSSVVGFSGADAKGLEGIELALDSWLRGTSLRVTGLRDALGRPVLSEGAHPTSSSTHDVVLSLDKLIQFETEEAIVEAARSVKPKTGWVAAVVMDPKTGDILALASAPSYNPNHYQHAQPEQRRNRAVSDAFEPGSTMKVFSIGTALELGLIYPGQVFDCERGRWRIGRHTIHDAHPHDKLPVSGCMQKSSNICAAKIGISVGKPRLHQFYKRFGFGDRSGVELPGERAGVLRHHSKWSDVGLANVAFGQGLTATVLQLTQAFSALGNGGVMMRPRLLLSIRNDRGETVKENPPSGKRVFSAGTVDKLLSMLRGVVEPGGTAVDAALERYTVAGKTGTAQKVDPVTRRYSTDRWVSSFIGVVPATRPRLVVAVVVNEPEGDKHYGGEVAGPVFKRIAEKGLAYLGVKPDRPPRRGAPARPLVASAVAREGISDEELPALPGEMSQGGEVAVPDFTGLSISEVISVARKADLRLEIEGSGRAVGQSPGPGAAPRRTTCRVSFRPPG